MARATSRRSRKNTISLPDMSEVEARVNVKEGEHLVKVTEVTQEQGDKAPYLAWKFEVVDGDSEGGILFNNTSLSEKALWNLKTLLEALGVDIPEGDFDVDVDDLVDRELMVTVEHETFEGKKRPRIVDFWAAEEEEPKKPARGKSSRGKKNEEEDEKPARGKSRTSSRKKKEEEEPEKVTQDEINEMDEDALVEFVENHELDVDLDKLKTLRRKKAAVIDAAEAAELIED